MTNLGQEWCGFLNRHTSYKNTSCPRGGTGRRARFKISFPQGSGGSIPSAGTIIGQAFLMPSLRSRIVRLVIVGCLTGVALGGPSRAFAQDKIALCYGGLVTL